MLLTISRIIWLFLWATLFCWKKLWYYELMSNIIFIIKILKFFGGEFVTLIKANGFDIEVTFILLSHIFYHNHGLFYILGLFHDYDHLRLYFYLKKSIVWMTYFIVFVFFILTKCSFAYKEFISSSIVIWSKFLIFDLYTTISLNFSYSDWYNFLITRRSSSIVLNLDQFMD